jgi:hypothetical protein
MRRVPASLTVCALLLAVAGCGGEDGVEAGATVSVYADAELCPGARAELARQGGEAGGLRVRVVCLDPVPKGGAARLARIGANARRATEDSTAVAYVGSADSTVERFGHPILEAADVGWTATGSGAAAMRRVLSAIDEADSGTLRDAVRESLEAG